MRLPTHRACLLIAIMMPIMIAACHTAKKKRTTALPLTPHALLEKIEYTVRRPDWLYLNGQISINTPQHSFTAGFAAINRKDSVIVAVAKKFGFVIAKARITPDSVTILDPVNKTYSTYPLAQITHTIGLPPRFDLIQDIIWGNPILITRQQPTARLDSTGTYIYTTHDDRFLNILHYDATLDKVNDIFIRDKQLHHNLHTGLLDFRPVPPDNTRFSFLRQIDVNTSAAGHVSIKVKIKKVTWNAPRPIRFSIPENYTPAR